MDLGQFRGAQRFVVGKAITRDNSAMPMFPPALVHQDMLEKQIKKAIRKLGKDVVHVEHSFGTDSTDEPSLYFRIVLADAATREDKLMDVVDRIQGIVQNEVRPLEKWGLLVYFSF